MHTTLLILQPSFYLHFHAYMHKRVATCRIARMVVTLVKRVWVTPSLNLSMTMTARHVQLEDIVSIVTYCSFDVDTSFCLLTRLLIPVITKSKGGHVTSKHSVSVIVLRKEHLEYLQLLSRVSELMKNWILAKIY